MRLINATSRDIPSRYRQPRLATGAALGPGARTRLACCLALGAAAGTVACDRDATEPPPVETPDGGSLPLAPIDLSLSTESERLAPGDREVVAVHAEPPGVYELQLSLPVNESSAFLDRSRVTTNAAGDGSFAVTVLGDGKVTVQATYGKSRGRLNLQVRERASGQLTLYPVYGGPRTITDWVVSTGEDADCANYGDYEDGQAFAADEPIVLETVLAATPVRVLVRAEHYVFGCQELQLIPGIDNVVYLAMTDRPLQLENLQLEFYFGFERTYEFSQHLEEVITHMQGPLEQHEEDGPALLDQMAQLASDVDTFGQASQKGQWEDVTHEYLLARGQSPSLLREQLDALLRQGSELLFVPEAVSGLLSATAQVGYSSYHALSVGEAAAADLSLDALPGLLPLESTAPETAGERWLRASFKLQWTAARLLGGLAASRLGDPVTSGLEPALLRAVDCSGLGQSLFLSYADALGDDSADPNAPTEAELVALCKSAISQIWEAAAEAEATTVSLEVGAAGQAEIDNDARPLGFAGNWVGALYLGSGGDNAPEPGALPDRSLPVRGTFSAR